MLACIRNGVVANIIIADGDFIKHIEQDFDAVVSAGNAGIGWTWDGKKFIAPEVPTE
jgi:hypothetical protein